MLAAGVSAPPVDLPALEGGRVQAPNGPVLLAFYKVSCPVCQLTFPYLQRMAGSVPVLGISQDDAEATREFNQEFGVTFATALDPAGDGYRASNAYQISNVPSLFQVDAAGQIVRAWSGFSKADLEAVAAGAGLALFTDADRVPVFRPG
jgi:peroxiredoxin